MLVIYYCIVVDDEIKFFFHNFVEEVDSKGYVKTDTCPNHFRKVVEICIRRSTSMISNNTQSSSEYSDSQYY